MQRLEILQKIDEKERQRDFNTHITPPNSKLKKVKPNYDYMRSSFTCKLGACFAKPIFKFAGHLFKTTTKLKIYGKNNLKNLNSGAILTVNHINNIDCALVRYATRGYPLDITVGEFNNFTGVFGSLLRSAGTLPFSDNPTCMKNLSRAIKQKLEQKHFVLFYPEGALWYNYRKPRPFLDGAFHFATKSNVPVIPMFFTFSNRKKRRDGTYSQNFHLHIGAPIYPNPNLKPKENIAYLKDQNEFFNRLTYTKFYGKTPEYLPETPKEEN